MLQSRMIGDARVTRVLEYTGPTHAPEFLFPEVPKVERDAGIAAQLGWLAPHHYVPAMDRFVVTIQAWLVHAGGNVILIDTGVGNFKTRAAPRMNNLNTLFLPWLEAAGAGPEQVTHVVHTHLHTDHVGNNTVLQDGRWVPTFPNARYLMPKPEFDHWKADFDRGEVVQAGSFADSVMPVVEAGLVDFYDGGKELAGCLMPEPVFGHAPGMFSLRLRSKGEEGMFSTDTMHSPIQVANPHWNDRYVLDAGMAREARARTLKNACERGALIMPFHFGTPHCGFVRRQGEGYAFEAAGW
ncbi:MAG: MBL fold metallo-hydrolase [Acetobacteraceae bacterium]|nr:MBL fold metallo-hydrolase [Acetobacteraceae bacterium]